MIKLKNLLSETKAWDREKFGDPLPTLEDVMNKHQETITEATRWMVGVEEPSGKITSTYGHWDGYPKHAGKMLKKYYSNSAKVKKLLDLGKAGISSIDSNLKKTDFSGDKGDYRQKWSNRDKLKFNSGEEFAYIWNAKEKKWYYKARYTNPQDWTELS